MSWIGIDYKTNEDMKACHDAKLWYWNLQKRAYWNLEEVYGDAY